jgi:3-deoxy-D-manno-octulosonic-acid transferase
MWKIVYNLLIYAALPILAVVALFKPKLRQNFMERIFPKPVNQDLDGGIWIHAASLGEAVIAQNLLKYLKDKEAEKSFVISTNTYYTRDLLRKKYRDTVETYSAPFDLSYSVRRFLGSRRFNILILVETEVWPNLIWIAKSLGIPVVIINGRISDSTIGRYRRLSFFLIKVLRSVDLVLAQSDEHARRFVAIGVEPSKVLSTGNLKYYRDIAESPAEPTDRKAITFGSIREKEIPLLMPLLPRMKKEFPDHTVFIVPRELHLTTEIERQIPTGFSQSKYSQTKGHNPPKEDIIIVDTVGDLLQIYAMSVVAFVGGSLEPYGGQNILEPLFVRTPVLFGPYVDNFRSVADQIISQGAGSLVETPADLLDSMRRLITDEAARSAMIEAGLRVLNLQRGAMKKTADMILETVWKNSRNS